MLNEFRPKSAAGKGLALCSNCQKLQAVTNERCERCDQTLTLRNTASLQMTMAFLITAMLFYIPANLYPIMTTTLLGEPTSSTILEGVMLFLEEGSYFVAFVIFTASVLIPLLKMLAIAWLCYSVQYRKKIKANELTKLYHVVEFIGKWSMIDVFVVAVLVALVQLSGLMTIEPGLAIRAFTIVVILTMISAHQFDVRLLWDKVEND